MEKRVPCPQCNGSGICASCSGIGRVLNKKHVVCGVCGGTARCISCNGSRKLLIMSLGKIDLSRGSLGMETMDGTFTALIRKGTPMPLTHKTIFSTGEDNQDSMGIHLAFGEEPKIEDNLSLGKVLLTGISPAPRGVPQIEFVIHVEEDGEVDLSAKDKRTGHSIGITVL